MRDVDRIIKKDAIMLTLEWEVSRGNWKLLLSPLLYYFPCCISGSTTGIDKLLIVGKWG